MNFKNLFFSDETKKAKNVTYADLLGIGRNFALALIKDKVTDQTDFDSVVAATEKTLETDLKRMGEEFEKIPAAFKNRIIGRVGCIVILGDDDGKLSTEFHLRDDDGLWDGKFKKYPGKGTTAKYKAEIFFAIEDEEED